MSIDIAGFIKDEELPGPLYYQSAYYLEPEKSAQKPYALLRKTLEKTKRVAIAKFALRDRERLVSVRALDGALLLNTLHWPDEVRSLEELNIPDEEIEVKPAERKMAEQLVASMSGEFNPEEYHDDYREALMAVIQAKVAGEAPAPAQKVEPTRIGDLMAALEASVASAREARREGATAKPKAATAKPKAAAAKAKSAPAKATSAPAAKRDEAPARRRKSA